MRKVIYALCGIVSFGCVHFSKRSPNQADIKGMVVTCQALAGQAGIEILRNGGNAADAYIATTMAEYVTAAGYTSLSGPLYLLYYDQSSKKTEYLNAGLNTVSDPSGQWSEATKIPGTAYVIGGAARGLESLHQRYGSKNLNFEDVIAPSIKLARKGFAIDATYARALLSRAPLFQNSVKWNELYRKNGQLLTQGELLVQSELADTLTHFGKEGADYLFKGAFASELVSTVQSTGGKLQIEDLKQYQVYWNKPLQTTYRGYLVQTSSYRSYGGLQLLLNLKTMENLAHFPDQPHFSDSPDSFNLVLRAYLFGQRETFPLMRFANHLEDISQMATIFDGEDPKKIADAVLDPSVPLPYSSVVGGHSCNTIVIDKEGNIATGTHTINTLQWGDYGQFVKGVILNSAHAVALDAPPGTRAIDGLNPVIVFKNDKPVIAAGFFASGLHSAALQVMLDLLDYEMGAEAALQAPRFGVFQYKPLSVLVDRRIPQSWVDSFSKKGISFLQPKGFIDTGMGMIIKIDPITGNRSGAATELLPRAVVMPE